MLIRQETINDHQAVYRLITGTFADAEHSDGNGQDPAEALRKNKEAFIPGLSPVAEKNGVIAGHILFTEMKVGTVTVPALLPL